MQISTENFSREDTIAVLKRMQKARCQLTNGVCTCLPGGKSRGENQTGCPELGVVLNLLLKMSDKEIEKYLS